MKNKVVPSQETQQEAMKIAKATQKPGQTKEQTKLIAQGIEKGIALYKKQHKDKARQADKAKKKAQKAKQAQHSAIVQPEAETVTTVEAQPKTNMLPWALLALSWIGFIIYVTHI
ncbi:MULTISPECIES: DUF2956 domain-containing protein [Vibrio]|uniref:DUF2956 domain-containing protein n=1 Tax=Vibrio TaxID=662 RepID=UPI002075C3B9|nr:MULTISPECIES: DUF2956 domain-containing protein [Vibrio]USD33232.1 DUF2956 domain-containing protein [Vibrio sp. SCSIO 43186]USD46301.1 DUF2956 domain-containing protein [Vibrio sp. SCSIO 43145]USD70356.1 DUF2956 domain-containing protein [Vibrio sp. SCSIO 43139]USD95273.1 hypothetical protein CTT30_03815 [Vibrio coralliilyticus]